MDLSASSAQQFPGLEPQIRHVSRAAIRKKWKRLRPGAEDNIRDILRSLKTQSKVTKSRRSVAKSDTQDCIDEVVERLISRLPRMPFPTSTNDENFDFELTLHRVQNIEEQLTSNIHSMNLLRQQIKVEEHRLREDRQEVNRLENNLKANNAVRSQQSKTLHPLVQHVRHQTRLTNADEVSHLEPLSPAYHTDLSVLEKSPDIVPVLNQLQDHLDTMQNNRSSMQGVELAIQNTGRALLDYRNNTMSYSKD